MSKEKTKQPDDRTSIAIEDLTPTETENVKGGAVDMFLKLTDVKGESKDYK